MMLLLDLLNLFGALMVAGVLHFLLAYCLPILLGSGFGLLLLELGSLLDHPPEL